MSATSPNQIPCQMPHLVSPSLGEEDGKHPCALSCADCWQSIPVGHRGEESWDIISVSIQQNAKFLSSIHAAALHIKDMLNTKYHQATDFAVLLSMGHLHHSPQAKQRGKSWASPAPLQRNLPNMASQCRSRAFQPSSRLQTASTQRPETRARRMSKLSCQLIKHAIRPVFTYPVCQHIHYTYIQYSY